MQLVLPEGLGVLRGRHVGWAGLLALVGLLWAPVLSTLWRTWESDRSLSHGWLMPLVAAGLLWGRRRQLGPWNAAAPGGLALLAASAFLAVAASWADIEFLKPLALIGVLGGVCWFLGGWRSLQAAAVPLGCLVFMIPWPTTLVARLAFPMQLTSSAYAALFAGLCGIPIHRSGVHLSVWPDLDKPPIYSILVAQQCSGLTSLIVLLTLGYLIACHTRVSLGWRAALVAAVVPIALLMNSVRLTLILIAGAHGSPQLAKWVHDHEAPVLIFFCSLALLGLRSALLYWLGQRTRGSDAAASPVLVGE